MKTRLIFYFTFAIILLVAVYFGIQKPTPEPEGKKFSFEMYWVPVTNYWSQTSNITTQELTNRKDIVVEKGEEERVAQLLRYSVNDVPKKDIREIQGGLKEGEVAVIKWSNVMPNLKTLSVDGKYLWDKDESKDYSLKVKIETDDPKVLAQKFNSQKLTKLTSIGDVILGRTVAKKITQFGVLHPWEEVAARIADADITFADLETPLSDKVKPPYEGMSFVAPSKAVEGLTSSGIDIVALANNHSTNFGTSVFIDTLDLLTKNQIKFVGGGKDLAEAEKAQVIEKNGQKWAFLDYNSIIGAIRATENSAGIAEFAIKPWAKVDNEEDIKKIENAVREAKNPPAGRAGAADVVVVELHWGVEYTAAPIQSQKNVAHRAIDAGADLVIGTHPHWVQGSEIYKGKYITYSLGNFIFDQEWSTETKQGTVLESYFYGKKQVAANLVPIQIEDYNQPRFVEGDIADQIIARIKNASIGL